MPVFLTLRNQDGNGLWTAMLPRTGQDPRTFRSAIVGRENSDPYLKHADAIRALGKHFGRDLDRLSWLTRRKMCKRTPRCPRLMGVQFCHHRVPLDSVQALTMAEMASKFDELIAVQGRPMLKGHRNYFKVCTMTHAERKFEAYKREVRRLELHSL